MLRATHGATAPTRRLLLAFTALALILASSPSARADGGLADVSVLPRIEGAVEDAARNHPATDRLTYFAPGSVAQAADAARRALLTDGWLPYTQPYQQNARSQYFKKGRHGLIVSVAMAGGKGDRSSVSYTAMRIDTNVPVPADATEIVFDEARPYLNCVTAAAVDATLGLLRAGLTEEGWVPLQASEAGLRWPHAKLMINRYAARLPSSSIPTSDI